MCTNELIDQSLPKTTAGKGLAGSSAILASGVVAGIGGLDRTAQKIDKQLKPPSVPKPPPQPIQGAEQRAEQRAIARSIEYSAVLGGGRSANIFGSGIQSRPTTFGGGK